MSFTSTDPCYDKIHYYVFRFHHDDTSAVHQLQDEVCGPSSMADDDLQGTQHIHRWYICICHQNAHAV